MSKSRKPGSNTEPSIRTKLSDNFVRALSNDFETHGNEIIEQLRQKHPERYAELVGRLIAGEQNAPDEKQKTAPTTTEGIARQALREVGMADEDIDEADIRLGVDAYCQFLTKLEQIRDSNVHTCPGGKSSA